MRSLIERAFALAVLLLACTMAAGCDSADESADFLAIQDSLQLAAVQQVIGDRPVQLISGVELCLVPFDAATLPECQDRPAHEIPSTQMRALREALREPSEGIAKLACVKVSRAITEGDSILVVVATVDDAEVDGVVESASQWVWFPREGGDGRGRVIPDPYGGASDVARLTDQAHC